MIEKTERGCKDLRIIVSDILLTNCSIYFSAIPGIPTLGRKFTSTTACLTSCLLSLQSAGPYKPTKTIVSPKKFLSCKNNNR